MAETTVGKLLTAATIGTTVYNITGSGEDAAAAAGYGAWVESITGALPLVERIDENRARVYLSDVQASMMSGWLEHKFQRVILPETAAEPPTLEIEFGKVVKPIALKYLIVFSALFFMTGWFSRGMIR